MSFYHQITEVNYKFISNHRIFVLPEMCKDKSVLHVGCMDWPVTNYSRNLHMNLDKVCSELVGLDTNSDNFEEMSKLLNHKELYDDLNQIADKQFDIMLIPEVLEHVDNMGLFLSNLSRAKCKKVIITVPDAYLCYSKHFKYLNSKEFHEIVHPDHNCWFSPYTLRNIVQKFTKWSLEEMFFLENMSIMGVFNNENV